MVDAIDCPTSDEIDVMAKMGFLRMAKLTCLKKRCASRGDALIIILRDSGCTATIKVAQSHRHSQASLFYLRPRIINEVS
jgi:hypothetical protein